MQSKIADDTALGDASELAGTLADKNERLHRCAVFCDNESIPKLAIKLKSVGEQGDVVMSRHNLIADKLFGLLRAAALGRRRRGRRQGNLRRT